MPWANVFMGFQPVVISINIRIVHRQRQYAIESNRVAQRRSQEEKRFLPHYLYCLFTLLYDEEAMQGQLVYREGCCWELQ